MEEYLRNAIKWLKDRMADTKRDYENIIAQKDDEIDKLKNKIGELECKLQGRTNK